LQDRQTDAQTGTNTDKWIDKVTIIAINKQIEEYFTISFYKQFISDTTPDNSHSVHGALL